MALDIRLILSDPDLIKRLQDHIQAAYGDLHGAQNMVIRLALKEYLDNHVKEVDHNRKAVG